MPCANRASQRSYDGVAVSATPQQRLAADVLIIGAGPSGSAAAISLARCGVDVLLVDQQVFPREKVCGDALIPDALAALESLGVRAAVCSRSRTLPGATVFGPNGRSLFLNGECAVLPRRVLDELLRAAAVSAGARFLSPCSAVGPLVASSRYTGARFKRLPDGACVDVEARWTLLATGAAGEVLRAFGVAQRVEASATAARLYLQVPGDLAAQTSSLVLSFDRRIFPGYGYGWLFPAPDNVLNVGVGIFHDVTHKAAPANLHHVMERFITTFAPARLASEAAISRTRFIGARLRTGLTGADVGRPGLLVTGEAAGATYSFSGEGIGKALETGMLAAATICDGLMRSADAEEIAAVYSRQLESRFRERFRAYKLVQDYLARPGVGQFLEWRANAGRFVHQQLEGLFNETSHPARLFSVSGLVRALFQ